MDISRLTPKQGRVLRSLGSGLDYDDTAAELHTEAKKVRDLLSHVTGLSGLSLMELLIVFADDHFCDEVLPKDKFEEAARLFNDSGPVAQATLNAFLDLWLEYMHRPEHVRQEMPKLLDVAKRLGTTLRKLRTQLNSISASWGMPRVRWYQLVRITYMARKYQEAQAQEKA